ncbi:barstar family protein [Herbidospora galbida]|uniref:Barstar family protein n=1 Tax=Herbidospora galbida TaxID=2575442 RepID=A0A4U3MG98_9ACTN|nr:barstar family protein [Herbidospora galbida]TKK86826.1 barstar family protein [Herbidospora galbida]
MLSRFVRAPRTVGVAAAIAEVKERGATPHLLDGAEMVTSAAAFEAIARALDFPEGFGHCLDSLYDHLTDLSWLSPGEHVLIWSKPSVLRKSDATSYDGLGSALSDAATDGTKGEATLTVIMLDN